MSYSLNFAIRDRLAAYIGGEISLHEFEDWFFPETWDVDQTGDITLTNLVYEIKLLWAGFSNGDWTEDELRKMLRPLFEKHLVEARPVQVLYGASNTNIRIETNFTPIY